MAIFVSGGTGYIGQKLVQALVRSNEEVHVLLRKQSDRAGLAHAKIRVFEGDILDKDTVRRALRGCTRAFHLAAYARVWAPSSDVYIAYNVGGLRNVLEGCMEVGTQRVVFTSSALTVGPTNGVAADENTPRSADFFTGYEYSKYLAEKEAAKYAARGLHVVTVNPARVYGPGKPTEANAVTRMLCLYAKGKFPLVLNRGEQIGNYVLVDDVVNGHLLAMEKGRAGERYVLGGENVDLKGLFEMLYEVSKLRKFQFHVPSWVARVVGSAEELRARLLHSSPFISRGWVETFLRDWALSSEKASRELGYTFTPLREGLTRTWKWLTEGSGRPFLESV